MASGPPAPSGSRPPDVLASPRSSRSGRSTASSSVRPRPFAGPIRRPAAVRARQGPWGDAADAGRKPADRCRHRAQAERRDWADRPVRAAARCLAALDGGPGARGRRGGRRALLHAARPRRSLEGRGARGGCRAQRSSSSRSPWPSACTSSDRCGERARDDADRPGAEPRRGHGTPAPGRRPLAHDHRPRRDREDALRARRSPRRRRTSSRTASSSSSSRRSRIPVT